MSYTKGLRRSASADDEHGVRPILNIKKLGIVSRDYRTKFNNNHRDFSFRLREVLQFLEGQACDSVLFSLYSIEPRQGFSVRNALRDFKHIRAVLLEEFTDGRDRIPGRFVVYYRKGNAWHEYEFDQKFGHLKHMPSEFVSETVPTRLLGNCCVLLCGETNGVKYSPALKKIEDPFELRASIPDDVKIILNPIHDRMTRFEMNLKQKFLSENGRWTVSVWNKGRKDVHGRTRDGDKPAWKIFHGGSEQPIYPIPNELCLEVGVVEF